MTDREMIEEMAKLDIEESAGFYSAYINDMRISKNKPLSVSKTIMTFDCPKKYILEAIGIPKDAVVLTKEEYEKLKGRAEEVFNEMTERMKAEVKIAKKMGIVKGSKETAREILNELYVQFSADYLVGLRNEYKDWKYADLIKRYAKSIGVEIKE